MATSPSNPIDRETPQRLLDTAPSPYCLRFFISRVSVWLLAVFVYWSLGVEVPSFRLCKPPYAKAL